MRHFNQYRTFTSYLFKARFNVKILYVAAIQSFKIGSNHFYVPEYELSVTT
jgi:hypothetical protein